MKFIVGLNVKVSYKVLNTEFEEPNVTYAETFSWQGEKFKKRPGENSVLVYRKKRSSNSKPSKSWSKQTEKPEAGVFVITSMISFINDYLVGSSRRPFRNPRQNFVIAITNTSEPAFNATCKMVLEKLWKDYGIGNVIIITPCHGDPEVFYKSQNAEINH